MIYFIMAIFVWEISFKDKKSEIKQLLNYKVEIHKKEEGILIKGEPEEEGSSSAWLYAPENIEISTNDTLIIKVKVLKNTLRLRYFLLSEDKRVYLLGIKYINESKEWKEIEIPLKDSKPFYSSNFPWSLLPDKKPSLYIFMENQYPGEFQVKISSVKVKGKRKGGK